VQHPISHSQPVASPLGPGGQLLGILLHHRSSRCARRGAEALGAGRQLLPVGRCAGCGRRGGLWEAPALGARGELLGFCELCLAKAVLRGERLVVIWNDEQWEFYLVVESELEWLFLFFKSSCEHVGTRNFGKLSTEAWSGAARLVSTVQPDQI